MSSRRGVRAAEAIVAMAVQLGEDVIVFPHHRDELRMMRSVRFGGREAGGMGLTRNGRMVMLGALTFGLLAPVPLARVAAQEATPMAECPVTTPEENKALVTQWFDALGSGNAEGVAALAADDIVYHDASPQEPEQTGGAGDWANSREADYPDLTVTVD